MVFSDCMIDHWNWPTPCMMAKLMLTSYLVDLTSLCLPGFQKFVRYPRLRKMCQYYVHLSVVYACVNIIFIALMCQCYIHALYILGVQLLCQMSCNHMC